MREPASFPTSACPKCPETGSICRLARQNYAFSVSYGGRLRSGAECPYHTANMCHLLSKPLDRSQSVSNP